MIPPLLADGRDIIVVKTTILDKNGNFVPYANNKINFSVEGAGKIIGVGNGDIASHEANKEPNRKAYNGLCAVIVQSTTEPGKIIIHAESPGLENGEFTIYSKSPSPTGISLDASQLEVTTQDTSFVTATINDKFGTVINTEASPVIFRIEGPGHFKNGKKIISIPAEAGKATAFLLPESGKENVRITATSGSLTPGRIELSRK